MRIPIDNDKGGGQELVVSGGASLDGPKMDVYVCKPDATWTEADGWGIRIHISQVSDVIAALEEIRRDYWRQVEWDERRLEELRAKSGDHPDVEDNRQGATTSD